MRVFDRKKEVDGKNRAIYEVHTSIKENFSQMTFWKGVIERLLDIIEEGRFFVVVQDDENQRV